MEDGGLVVQNLKCLLSVGFLVRFLDACSQSVCDHPAELTSYADAVFERIIDLVG